MSSLKIVDITASKKFLNIGTPNVVMQNIADDIALLLYGKRCTTSTDGILGERQEIANLASLRKNEYVVHIPTFIKEIIDSNPVPIKYGRHLPFNTIRAIGGHMTKCADINSLTIERFRYINNMINHGINKGIRMRIVYD